MWMCWKQKYASCHVLPPAWSLQLSPFVWLFQTFSLFLWARLTTSAPCSPFEKLERMSGPNFCSSCLNTPSVTCWQHDGELCRFSSSFLCPVLNCAMCTKRGRWWVMMMDHSAQIWDVRLTDEKSYIGLSREVFPSSPLLSSPLLSSPLLSSPLLSSPLLSSPLLSSQVVKMERRGG